MLYSTPFIIPLKLKCFPHHDHIKYIYIYNYVIISQEYIDAWAQGWSNSSALVMELLQSCTEPSIYAHIFGRSH